MVSMPNGDENITRWNMHPSNAHDARGGVAEFFPKDTTPQWFDCVFVVPAGSLSGSLSSPSTQLCTTSLNPALCHLAAAPPHIRLSPTPP